VLRGEQSVQSGSYFRSDHFSFAKAGVPALYAGGGSDLREGGTAASKRIREEYGRTRYHAPGDEYDPAVWKLDGTVEDLELLYGVGRELASGGRWPAWYEGTPFRAARDAQMRARPAGGSRCAGGNDLIGDGACGRRRRFRGRHGQATGNLCRWL